MEAQIYVNSYKKFNPFEVHITFHQFCSNLAEYFFHIFGNDLGKNQKLKNKDHPSTETYKPFTCPAFREVGLYFTKSSISS